MSNYIDIVFDGPPGPVCGRFVEVENDKGASIRVGEWVKREDGYWVLRFQPNAGMTPPPPAPATDYGVLLRDIRDAMALGHSPGTEWLDSWVREKMTAAADAIEALTAIVSAREDMDVQHGEVIDQQAGRIVELEKLLRLCVPWLKVYQSGEEAFWSSLAGQRVLELLADIDAALAERQPREEGTR